MKKLVIIAIIAILSFWAFSMYRNHRKSETTKPIIQEIKTNQQIKEDLEKPFCSECGKFKIESDWEYCRNICKADSPAGLFK